MREELVGYLLDALSADERAAVERRLRQDPRLQYELELLHDSLEPLRNDEEVFAPPPGLALRACAHVSRHTAAVAGHLSGVAHAAGVKRRGGKAMAPALAWGGKFGGNWSLADLVVAAGIFLAATTLLFPALQHSRNHARIAGCQNNLRQLGASLAQYSQFEGGYFPAIPSAGKLAAAGLYAVELSEKQLLPDEQLLLCPNSPLAAREADSPFHVPTRPQLQVASGAQLASLHKAMGGSYGYNLGYMQDGDYRTVRNQGRPTFAMMADAPSLELEGRRSKNHNTCGQNVLYEDGHVRFVTNCMQEENSDHIYLNDDGLMAAGTHEHDATVGASHVAPLPRVITAERR